MNSSGCGCFFTFCKTIERGRGVIPEKGTGVIHLASLFVPLKVAISRGCPVVQKDTLLHRDGASSHSKRVACMDQLLHTHLCSCGGRSLPALWPAGPGQNLPDAQH